MSGQLQTSEQHADWNREAFVQGPHKSTRRASTQLGIPVTSVCWVLHKRLGFKPSSCSCWKQFQKRIKWKECLLWELSLLSDEATFHLRGIINNVHIWGSENSHASAEFVCNLPEVNVFCALSTDKMYGPFEDFLAV